jgi:hypothetical protein
MYVDEKRCRETREGFDFLFVLLSVVLCLLYSYQLTVLTTNDSYLVDPASSHMLVSKIKPCMSKYKSILYLKLRIAH